jgi:hypothetical protein
MLELFSENWHLLKGSSSFSLCQFHQFPKAALEGRLSLDKLLGHPMLPRQPHSIIVNSTVPKE